MQREILQLPPPPADERIPYGDDPNHFADIRVPEGKGPHPVAIVIHGGFWRAAFNLEHAGHMCQAFRFTGVATWSLEYRRIGQPGGGYPGTLEDVAQGAAHLRKIADRFRLDLSRTAAIGHSAGGHLALWLAAEKPLPLRGAVALGGVCDLRRAYELKLGNLVVNDFIGAGPDTAPDRYRRASPIERLPLRVPSRLVHGADDNIVPLEIGRRFEEAARKAGDDCRLIPLPGAGHFEVIDPRKKEFTVVRETLLELLR